MTQPNEYIPPEVWSINEESDGRFAGINRPTAGPRFEAELPRGKHSLQLYSLATPNGQKVTIMLEELLAAGVKDAEYDAHLIRIMDQEQFSFRVRRDQPQFEDSRLAGLQRAGTSAGV